MARKPLRVPVLGRDQKELRKLLSSGIQPVRVVLRALAVLHWPREQLRQRLRARRKGLAPKRFA